MNRFVSPAALWLMAFLLGVAAIGCSKGAADRTIVSGAVTYQGQPVAAGRILFLPTAGDGAFSCGAEIADGRYEASAKGGVPAGTFAVKIFAYRDSSSPASKAEVVGVSTDQPQEQYLPAKYNEKSELTLTVNPNQKQITQDFDLR